MLRPDGGCGIVLGGAGHDGYTLGKRFFDLRGDFEREGVEALGEVANVLQKLVVKDNSRDSGEKTGCCRDQGFSNARSDGAQASRAGIAKTGEGVNNAPDCAEQADERADGSRGGEPGHAFFHAPDFFRRGELHVYGDRRKAFQFAGRMRIAGRDLRLQFAVTGCVNVRKRRAGGGQRLRVGNAACCAEDAEKLAAIATDAAEQAQFLENQRPGDHRKDGQQRENAASHPAGLRKNVPDVCSENCAKQRNNVVPSEN